MSLIKETKCKNLNAKLTPAGDEAVTEPFDGGGVVCAPAASAAVPAAGDDPDDDIVAIATVIFWEIPLFVPFRLLQCLARLS